eukprot:jgi/Tetstr1/447898/TSEL_035206.t1
MDTSRGITEADIWLRLAEGLLPAYDQPQPSEATTDQQPAATPANILALAEVRAWAEYEANTDADDAVICPPTRIMLTLLEIRESRYCGRYASTYTIVSYLTESQFDPSELLIHPFSQTIREAGELRGNAGHNQIRRAAIGLRKKARKTAPASLALRATGRPIYTLTLQLTAHHHSIIGGTRSTDRTYQWRKTVVSTACGKIKAAPAPALTVRRHAERHIASPTTGRPNPTATSSDPSNPNRTPAIAQAAIAMPVAQADDEEELELNYEENDSAMEVDTTQGEAAETPASPPQQAKASKTATTAKIKKKQPRGRSRSDGATRNRSKSKPRLSGTRSSDSEWITDDDAAHPSNSSHQ